MKQALEALELWSPASGHALNKRAEAVVALRAAIEQAQDPETELETYKRLYELRGKALERPCSNCGHQPAKIKAMAQPEQEPVAWMYHGIRHDDTPHERPSLIWKLGYMDVMSAEKGAKATPLYTAPRQWQGLTDEDVDEVERWIEFKEDGSGRIPNQKLVRYIERKLKEKNT